MHQRHSQLLKKSTKGKEGITNNQSRIRTDHESANKDFKQVRRRKG